MFDLDRWQEILASIQANKLRTFLSGVTIALALFVFIMLFGLSKGLQNGFEEQFFPSNAKAIYITSDQTSIPYKGKKSERIIKFDNSDYQLLLDSVQSKVEVILPVSSKSVTARYHSEQGNYILEGTIPEKKKLDKLQIISGRFLDGYDGKDIEKNVVIGRLVEKDLFKNEKAIGKNIQLGNTLYKVIGVFSSEDGDNEERKIYLPLTTLQVIYGTSEIDDFTLLPLQKSNLDEIKSIAEFSESLLKSKHFVSPKDSRGINAYDPSKGLKTTNMFFVIFTIIVFIIGIGSLIAGIVSIGNMMVFSVKERTKEIGIRKALGAKPSNIIGLIMQEAIIITLIFGFIGIFSALLLIEFIKGDLEIFLIINPTVEKSRILIASVILFISGILAGFLPARKAAKIKPIDALRQDR